MEKEQPVKIIYSKFPGTCTRCKAAFPAGEPIHWQRFTGATHVVCPSSRPENVTAPCWECQAEGGRFRSYGAATPVYCDACEVRIRARVDAAKIGPVIIDRHDLDWEDSCRDACGL